jgi:hypothetical protein
MGNIVGNNPKKWASNQVKLRQQLLGLQNKTPDVLTWSTNNTAWIRAISSVSISGSVKSKELTGSENYQGGKLAKEFMLFSGTSALNETTDGGGNITYKSIPKSGVLNTSWGVLNNTNTSAYGFAGSAERGLVPMPGIISLDINTYNRGSLRNASLKIKAYNREQFAILDALFMHPGYSLLIEWGHTIYFKGSPETLKPPIYQPANFNTKAFQELNKFLDGNGNIEQGSTSILKAITAERGNGSNSEFDSSTENGTQGNYDGFYGKITNFVWGLNNDGSYDIEVKAISIGDVIESLTINNVVEPDKIASPTKKNEPNSSTPKASYYFNLKDKKGEFQRSVPEDKKEQYFEYWDYLQKSSDPDFSKEKWDQAKSKYSTAKEATLKRPPDSITPEPPLDDDILITAKDKTVFNRWLYDQYNYLKTNISKKGTKIKTTKGSSSTIQTLNTYGSTEGEFEGLVMVQPLVLLDKTDGSSGEVKGKVSRLSKNAPYQYIKLQTVLEFIQNKLFMQSADTNNKNPSPYIGFDLGAENYMYTQPGQLSADPNVCVIPFQFPKPLSGNVIQNSANSNNFPNKITDENVETYWSEVLKNVDFNNLKSNYVANLLSIPVNIHYIAQTLQQATSNNAVKLLPFLESLMYGIQEALGSLNEFSVTYDHDSNQIIIRDDIPLDPTVATETSVPPDDRTFFNVTGYKPIEQNGSFISNVGVSTTLSNAFATMISIGAQSQSQSDIANGTSLSKFNKGLIDSVTPSKISKAVASKENASKNDPTIIFAKTITSLNKTDSLLSYFYKNGKVPSGDLISSSKSQSSAFNRYVATTDLKRKGGEELPSSQGFIPFSMNLDMMGFSGLRIYEKFYITTEILPKSYPDTMSFLVKGLSHSVDSSGWKTKIDSLTITNVDPKNQELPNITNSLPNPYNK